MFFCNCYASLPWPREMRMGESSGCKSGKEKCQLQLFIYSYVSFKAKDIERNLFFPYT